MNVPKLAIISGLVLINSPAQFISKEKNVFVQSDYIYDTSDS